MKTARTEMRAALAGRRRDGTLHARDFTAARGAFEADWFRYVAVDVTAVICREAGDLAERYLLRGFDGVHLASFEEMARGVGGADARFSSVDDRLNRAAKSLARALARTRRSTAT